MKKLFEDDELEMTDDAPDMAADNTGMDSVEGESSDTGLGEGAPDTETPTSVTDMLKTIKTELESIEDSLGASVDYNLGKEGSLGPVLESDEAVYEFLQEGVFKDIVTNAKNTVKNFVNDTIVGDIISDGKDAVKAIKSKFTKKHDKRKKGKYGSDKYKTSRKVTGDSEEPKKTTASQTQKKTSTNQQQKKVSASTQQAKKPEDKSAKTDGLTLPAII